MWKTIVAVPAVLLENWEPLFSETGPDRYVKMNAFYIEKEVKFTFEDPP